ncbi:MAG: glycoside hydrolase family 113, partial [Planctomycetota bacterium]
IVKCAEIGEETGAEVLIIGSELISTECQVQRWKRLIAKVRSVYKGRLCYSANWDHYRPITWWDQLDMIGMTAYHNLSRGKKPTPKLLKEAWQPLREKILKWRNEKYPNHPILFTEVGWPNQVTCAEYPWDYYRATNRPDPQTQADCFEAFFATWMDEPAVAGYLIWEWRNHPDQRTGPRDTSYVPCGKPAQTVIEKHFRSAAEKKLMSGSAERRARSRRAVE